ELEELKALLLDRIEAAARENALLTTPMLDFALHFWDQNRTGAGTIFAVSAASTDSGFAELAVGALQPRPPLARDAAYRSEVKLLENWTGKKVEELAARCEQLLTTGPHWLLEKHNIALRALIDEVKHPRDPLGVSLNSPFATE